ncbi:MAG: LysM peptidoglycan-binding domain-containing protein [Candidatus Saccharimonadales bacterium]
MSAVDVRENSAKVLASASGAVNDNVDETTSTFVAANIASGLGISVADDITARSESISSGSELISSDNTHLRKASAVATDNVSREDITTYTVKSGDTISDIARKFAITSDTVRWANDIPVGGSISVGDKLTILPINGVLHKVASGDTPEKLADKYEASAALITSFNDAEVTGLIKGQKVIIPDGVKDEPSPVATYLAGIFPTSPTGSSSYKYELWPTRPRFTANSYYAGQCTWWAHYRANQLGNPVSRNLGNANQWVGTVTEPIVGAVGQNYHGGFGFGHVAVVEAVSEDGSMIKYSDMNGLAGSSIYGNGSPAVTTDWVPASHFTNYLVF